MSPQLWRGKPTRVTQKYTITNSWSKRTKNKQTRRHETNERNTNQNNQRGEKKWWNEVKSRWCSCELDAPSSTSKRKEKIKKKQTEKTSPSFYLELRKRKSRCFVLECHSLHPNIQKHKVSFSLSRANGIFIIRCLRREVQNKNKTKTMQRGIQANSKLWHFRLRLRNCCDHVRTTTKGPNLSAFSAKKLPLQQRQYPDIH